MCWWCQESLVFIPKISKHNTNQVCCVCFRSNKSVLITKHWLPDTFMSWVLLHQLLLLLLLCLADRELPIARSVTLVYHVEPVIMTATVVIKACVMGFPLANGRDQRITMPSTVYGHLYVSLALRIRFIYKVIRDLPLSGRTTTPMVTHGIYQQYTASYSLLWCWFKDLKQTEQEAGEIRQTETGFPREHFCTNNLLIPSEKFWTHTKEIFSALTSDQRDKDKNI